MHRGKKDGQWNGQWKTNNKTFVLVVLMMMLMAHSCARFHNENLAFSSLVVLGACPVLSGGIVIERSACTNWAQSSCCGGGGGALLSLALVAVVSHELSAAAARVFAFARCHSRRSSGGAHLVTIAVAAFG